jgi:PII-like signaling protein
MLNTGKALKVSIYISEGSSYHGVPCYSRILDYLFFNGVSGATVLKGVAGFGADHHIHSSSFVEISDKLPLKVEFVESPEKVESLLSKLTELAGSGMIEVQETTIAKAAWPSKKTQRPAQPHLRTEGKGRLMRIYIGESDRWDGKPLHEALIKAMRAHDLAGATVYRGILGYGVHGRLHRESPIRLSRDASIMLSVVDTEEKLRAFIPVIEQMVQEGLIVLSDVDIIRYAHRPLESQDQENAP